MQRNIYQHAEKFVSACREIFISVQIIRNAKYLSDKNDGIRKQEQL